MSQSPGLGTGRVLKSTPEPATGRSHNRSAPFAVEQLSDLIRTSWSGLSAACRLCVLGWLNGTGRPA